MPIRKKFNNLEHVLPRRRTLRNHSTSAEATLWTLLKDKQLDGFKFRRQHSIGEYVLDFYCPKKKLAVELDGNYHKEESQATHDAKRTGFINSKGITVIRIENNNVFDNTSAVLDYIRQHLK